jgi:hypothetical protein
MFSDADTQFLTDAQKALDAGYRCYWSFDGPVPALVLSNGSDTVVINFYDVPALMLDLEKNVSGAKGLAV